MSDIEVSVDAITQQAVDNLNQVGDATAGLGAKVTQSASQAKQSSMSWTELQSKINLAKEAVQIAGDVFQHTLGDIMSYDAQIRKLSETMGVSTEEASRLYQAADDLGMNVDSFTQQMALAVKNGFVPNKENLAELADLYVTIQDPLQRADALTAKFGKNWTEIVPVLKGGRQAVEDAYNAVGDGLVRTEAQVKASRDLEKAIDDVNDSFEAFKIAIFGNAIPALALLLTETQKIQGALEQHKTDVIDTSDSYDAYTAEIYRTAGAVHGFIDAQGNLRLNNGKIIAQNYLLDETTWKAMHSTKGLSDAAMDAGTKTREYTDAQKGLVAATEKSTDDANALTKADLAHVDALRFQNQEYGYSKQQLDQLVTANNNLAAAQDQLTQSQKAWASGAGGDIASALEQQGLKGQALYDALKQVDDVMGTNLEKQREQKDQIVAVAKLYDQSKPEAFKNALQKLKDAFQPLDESVMASQKKVDDLTATLNALDGRVITTTIQINQSGSTSVSGVGNSGRGSGKGGGGRASGGPMDAGVPYWVGERGPEIVVPNQPSTVIPNNQIATTTTINIYGWQGDAASLAREMEWQKQIQRMKQ